MRPSPLLSLVCFVAFHASAQSADPVPAPTPALTLNLKPAITIVLPRNLTLLSRNSTCYVIDSREFPQTGSNFNPAAPTTHSVCQPASQYHLKGATATPAR